MKKHNIKKLAYPTLAIAGASILLFIILAALSIQNYNREKELLTKQLYREGSALIRILEASMKNGMMSARWKESQIQTLLTETAKEPNIDYIMVVDNTGIVLAHNQSKYIGNKVNGLKLPQKAGLIISAFGKNSENEDVFNMVKLITPLTSSNSNTNYKMRMGNQCMNRWNSFLSGKYIIVGLKMNEFKAAQAEDVRRAIISGLILLILGSASLYFLFVVQSYYLINNTLKSLESYTANVVNSMPNGLISLDSEGRITTLNQNAADLLGLAFPKVKGMQLKDVMKECDLRNTLLPASDIFEQQKECRLNDGRVIPLSITSSLLKDEEGKIIGKVIILRDLQDIKTLEKKIERSERLASLGRMAAGIAHEIRNPLSSIKGFAQYFRKKFAPGSEDENYALVMANEVDRLNRFIQDLLNFAKPQEPKFRPVDIIKTMEHTLKLTESDFLEKDIRVIKKFDEQIPQISADNDMLIQAFLNIIINANEAMEENGELIITVRKNHNQSVHISIEDKGKGIAKTDLRKIFDPFFTLKSGGSGLGLAIVYRIVENHHGEIEVKSEPGKGTIFKINLPFKQI
jgi:two-component system sensor histidine kinase HydH